MTPFFHTDPDHAGEAERLFVSLLCLSIFCGSLALYGAEPPDPAVHWPAHKWIHFMKRLHVIMSIGAFLIEVCATFFCLFALHRVLSGGFDTRAPSTAIMLMRELEFEYVAVCSYAFGGAWLLMGPVAVRCFCMVQQGLRSDTLAASVCCLIVGIFLLILSFFNAHLVAYPYEAYDGVVLRFLQLSLTRCQDGGRPAVITALAWALQAISVLLALLSLIETFPWNYYRELDRASALAHAAADRAQVDQAAAEASGRGHGGSGSDRFEDAMLSGLPYFGPFDDGLSDLSEPPPSMDALRGSGAPAARGPSHAHGGRRTPPINLHARAQFTNLLPTNTAARWGFGHFAGSVSPPQVPTRVDEEDDGSSSATPIDVALGGANAGAAAAPWAGQATHGAAAAAKQQHTYEHPWSLALAQIDRAQLAHQAAARLGELGATYAPSYAPSAAEPRTARRRGGGVSKVSSAASLRSLDSTIVD